jgi:hypothetical protein
MCIKAMGVPFDFYMYNIIIWYALGKFSIMLEITSPKQYRCFEREVA